MNVNELLFIRFHGELERAPLEFAASINQFMASRGVLPLATTSPKSLIALVPSGPNSRCRDKAFFNSRLVGEQFSNVRCGMNKECNSAFFSWISAFSFSAIMFSGR